MMRPTGIRNSLVRFTHAVQKVCCRRSCWHCRLRSAFALPDYGRPVEVGIQGGADLDFVDIVDGLVKFHGCLWLH